MILLKVFSLPLIFFYYLNDFVIISIGFLGPQHPSTSRDVLDTYYIGDIIQEEQ